MFKHNAWFVIIFCAVLMNVCFSACARRSEDTASVQAGLMGLSSADDESREPGSETPATVLGAVSDAADPSDGQGEDDGLSAGPALAARERVDDSFFADAAFFGNSLMEGLGGYGGLESGSFFGHARTALYNMDTEKSTVLDGGGTGTLYEAMTQRQYGKIYVLLGINEIGWEADFFADRFGMFLERLQRDEPEAEIYIMSLSPVTSEVSGTHEYFNMDRVRAYNGALLALAEETGCWYLDLCQALAGEDGYLPPESAAADGIHLTQDAYLILADYLRTHYAGAPAADTGN